MGEVENGFNVTRRTCVPKCLANMTIMHPPQYLWYDTIYLLGLVALYAPP